MVDNKIQEIRVSAVSVLTVLLVSCASSSGEIAASYVSPTQYAAFNCNQLALELARLNRRKTDLAANIDKKASGDEGLTAVSALLFWPAAFAIGGNQAQEAEYARLKGEYDAVQKAGIEKNCKLDAIEPTVDSPLVKHYGTSAPDDSAAFEYYGEAEQELISGNVDPNLWARAFVEAEGDDTKRKAKYIELRAGQLFSESGGSVASVAPGNQGNAEQNAPLFDVSGNYQSEITTNSKWQFLKRYKDLEITITQSGSKIKAIDNRYQTKIEGTLEGNVIKFHVNPNVVSGFYDAEGEWQLKDDRTGFEGNWRSLG